MAESVYLGESNGGRIIRLGGAALTQVTAAGTEPVLADLGTWDILPMGPAGDSTFRMIVVTLRYTNGYAVRVTPSVDGVALEAQDFSGSGAGQKDCQVSVQARGARVSVRVQALSRTGDLEVLNVEPAYFPLRAIP